MVEVFDAFDAAEDGDEAKMQELIQPEYVLPRVAAAHAGFTKLALGDARPEITAPLAAACKRLGESLVEPSQAETYGAIREYQALIRMAVGI